MFSFYKGVVYYEAIKKCSYFTGYFIVYCH